MCGIAGALSFNGQQVSPSLIRQMTDAMAHRGPDADALYTEGEIGLGHRRLAIIDLSEAANQPFTDNSGRYIIVFNGELYNFEDVKATMPDYNYRTQGDTEAMLVAFIRRGPASISAFKGMFALALWDREEKSLYLVRDRMGVKPLYYYVDAERLVFASEIRPILATGFVRRQVSRQALKEFLSYQSVGHPHVAIEGIQQVEAGGYLKIKDGRIENKHYWDVSNCPVDFDFADTTAVRGRIAGLMATSVEKRLISDVPIGAFLSGGIDSSAVVGLMAQVSTARPNTFTVSFTEKAFDESEYAGIIAKKFNTRHTNIPLQPTVFLDELENALNAMDTPSADGINTYVVSKAIRQAGMTVALSGIGGDELFAGYPFFKQYLKLQEKKNWFRGTSIPRKLAAGMLGGSASTRLQRIRQIIAAEAPDIQHMYPVSRQILAPALIRRLTTFDDFRMEDTDLYQQLQSRAACIGKYPLLSQVSMAEYLGYTQHTLLKDTDQMSMAVSLEVREPFFDHELVSFVLNIPDTIKYPTFPKSLLVDSLHPLLPDEIVHRKKQGFVFPWSEWMKKELRSFCSERISRMGQRSFIKGKELEGYWQRFLNND
ncbi:MAG TPA: asparagine synthase (glutamine-hydrolyzing), partial [Chitinophagaceae bacterium]